MNRKLFLIRHSYAEPMGSKPDKERTLTMEGQSTIRALGRHLKKESFHPELIICSSSVRTRETAVNLMEELEISDQIILYEDIIYNASVREMLNVVNALDSKYKDVVIIGHNPTITYFGEYLTNSGIGNMEPSSMVEIKIEGVNWQEVSQGSGNFISYFHPNHNV